MGNAESANLQASRVLDSLRSQRVSAAAAGTPGAPPDPVRPAAALAAPRSQIPAKPLVQGWLVQVPNALIVVRLVLAVVLIGVLSFWRYPDQAEPFVLPTSALLFCAALFGAAALTDAIDGHLARRWRVVSKFGRVMDPFADKVLVIGALVMLAGPAFHVKLSNGTTMLVSGVHPWMAVAVIGRELLVTSLRGLIESRGKSFAATASGKWKMILQSLVVPLVLVVLALFPAWPGSAARWTIDGAVWLTVIVTVLSAGPYVARGIEALRESRPLDQH